MIRILLICLLSLISITDHAQNNPFSADKKLNVRIFEIVEGDYSQVDSQNCFTKIVSFEHKKDQITIKIDSVFEGTFVELNNKIVNKVLTRELVRVGQPHQIYTSHERLIEIKQGEQTFLFYYFQIGPIYHRHFNKDKPISGTVIQISNQKLCK